MDAGYPDHLVLVPFWTAVALFLDGLERPYLPRMAAFGIVALAVWGTHWTFGVLLTGAALIAGFRVMTSIERLQEGLPLLLVLWVPWIALTGAYVALRWIALGDPGAYGLPATGLLEHALDRGIVDPTAPPAGFVIAELAAVLFLPVILLAARGAPAYFLFGVTALALLGAHTPWLAPAFASLLGSGIHYLVWVVPLGFVLTAQASWAWGGLMHSGRWTGMRTAVLFGVGLATVAALVSGIAATGYRPARVAALHAADRELDPLVEDARDLAPGTVLADPTTAAALSARTGLGSVYTPDPGWDAVQARARFVAARETLLGWWYTHADSGGGDDLARGLSAMIARYPADLLVTTRSDPGDLPPPEWPVEAQRVWEETLPTVLPGDAEHRLGGLGVAFDLRDLPETGAALDIPAGRPAAPHADSLRAERSVAAAGSVFVLHTTWGVDPWSDGYRVRAELTRVDSPATGWLDRTGRMLGRLRDFVLRRPHAWSVETPLNGGRPPHWWRRAQASTAVRIPLPEGLKPGTYAVRIAALSGPVAENRLRPDRSILPGEPLLEILVQPPSRRPTESLPTP
jgi:hypothetical protein